MNRNKRTYFYLAVHVLSLFLLVSTVIFILNNIKYFDEIMGNYRTKLSVLSSTFSEEIKTVIIAPISEEVIFREWIYNFLKKRTKFYNIIQAILFALFHMILIDKVKIEENIIISFFFSIITGVVYGNIKEKTGNLNCAYFFILYTVLLLLLLD